MSKWRIRTIPLVLLNLFIFGALAIDAPTAKADEAGAYYAQACICKSEKWVNGVKKCYKWQSVGCPRSPVQTCGVECSGGGESPVG